MKMLYYFIDSDGATQGPVALQYFKQNYINGHSWVWHDGVPQWVEAHTVPSLRKYMRSDISVSFSTKKGIVDLEKEKFNTPNRKVMSPSEMDELRNQIPKTWLVESILVTIFCCIPFGVAAIVYASRVATFWRRGVYSESINASDLAAFWVKLAVTLTIIFWILYAVLWMFTPVVEHTVDWYNNFWITDQYQ